MSAELAKPDSMGDLDQDADEDAEEEEEMEKGEGCQDEEEEDEPCNGEREEDKEAEERISLLTEDQKEKSSPSIQLVAGEPAVPSLVPVQHPQLGAVSSGSSRGTIKVDIDQGPSPR